jgi:hypothetical protein
MGEEQGLLGSLAYVKQHQGEMKNHLGGIVLDFGQGPIKEFQLGDAPTCSRHSNLLRILCPTFVKSR